MPKTEMLPVDYFKLACEMKKRGLELAEASAEMGYARSYLSHVSVRQELCKSSVVQIERQFGIRYEDIKLTVPEPKPEPAPKVETLMQVQDGTADALKDIAKKLDMMAEQFKRVVDLVEPLKEPMTLYKTIFMPIYAAVRSGEVDKAADDEKKRRIDGTPIINGFRRNGV